MWTTMAGTQQKITARRYFSILAIIGSGNGLTPDRRHTITYINDDLLSIKQTSLKFELKAKF